MAHQILSNLSFLYHKVIERSIVQLLTALPNYPQKIYPSLNFVSRLELHVVSLQLLLFLLFFNLNGGTLGTAATTGLLYQPRMIGEGDCGEIGGMKIGRGNLSTRRKPAPAPLCPPQIPHV
jgi:hypothetical protein